MKLCEVYSVCTFLICLWVVREARASLEENKVNVTAERGNYDEAVNYCKTNGLKLIRINNDSDNSLVYGLALNNSIGRYWIDGKWNRNEATWVNLDNATLSYTKWDRVEPNNKSGSEFCVEGNFYSSEYWNDIDCDVRNGIICYDDKVTTKITVRYKRILGANNERVFQTHDQVESCKGINATLPRIESEEMMAELEKKVAADNAIQNGNIVFSTYFWMDLTRDKKGSPWKYSNGTDATYTEFDGADDNAGDNCACFQNGDINRETCSNTRAVFGDTKPSFIDSVTTKDTNLGGYLFFG